MIKAVLCDAFGPPDQLRLGTIESPRVSPGEVKVAVHAAGLNFPDVLMVQGLYQLQPPFPFSPGLEVAGRVTQVGEGVTHIQVGDRVIGIVSYGGFAEEVCVPAAMTLPMPDNMSYEDGAVFPIVYGTSHVALGHRAHLQAGETLLVLGAAGGVGLTAVEIGKRMGARVIAAASTNEKLALARDYGADMLINYSEESLRDRVKTLTQGRYADVIYDPVGGDLFDEATRCLAWEGRYLVIGFASGRIPEIAANRLLLKNSSLVGTFWGAYAINKPRVMIESMQSLLGWYAEGGLHPYISERYPLERAGEALTSMMNRQTLGKVVISVRPDAN